MGLLRRLFPPSAPNGTNEAWVRRQLAKHGGTFTYRVLWLGECWNPEQSGLTVFTGFNPIVGPAEVTYSSHPDGSVTAIVRRPGEAHEEHLGFRQPTS